MLRDSNLIFHLPDNNYVPDYDDCHRLCGLMFSLNCGRADTNLRNRNDHHHHIKPLVVMFSHLQDGRKNVRILYIGIRIGYKSDQLWPTNIPKAAYYPERKRFDWIIYELWNKWLKPGKCCIVMGNTSQENKHYFSFLLFRGHRLGEYKQKLFRKL